MLIVGRWRGRVARKWTGGRGCVARELFFTYSVLYIAFECQEKSCPISISNIFGVLKRIYYKLLLSLVTSNENYNQLHKYVDIEHFELILYLLRKGDYLKN